MITIILKYYNNVNNKCYYYYYYIYLIKAVNCWQNLLNWSPLIAMPITRLPPHFWQA